MGQAEVRHLGVPHQHQNVVRLDVPVQHLLRVQVIERLTDLQCDVDGLRLSELATSGSESFFEGLTADELYEAVLPVAFAVADGKLRTALEAIDAG